MELFQRMRFNENPFSKYSAEEEIDYIDEIFIQPRYYETLSSDLKKNNSRFISGLRGSGKSALIYKLLIDLRKVKYITVLVDNYDNIKLSNNDSSFILLLIRNLLKEFIVVLSKNPKFLKSMSKEDKEKLSYIIENHFQTLTKHEYLEKVSLINNYNRKKSFSNILNIFNKPINLAINGVVEISSDFVRKCFKLPEVDTQMIIKQYIPGIEIKEPSKDKLIKELSSDYSYLKKVLNELCQIINKEIPGVIIFFDKIDEFKKLEGKTDKIITFVKSILNDTELLMNKNFSLVFSLWSEITKVLSEKGVRFDKFKPIDITWKEKDIRKMIDSRLKYFSIEGNMTFSDIVKSANSQKKILTLANNSPRELITILSAIYDEHTLSDDEPITFEDNIIDIGLIDYAKKFPYYSHYPTKKGTKEDIFNIINKLLDMELKEFTVADYSRKYKMQARAASSYIKIMKNYRLIKDDHTNTNKAKKYIIIDKKINLMIDHGIKSLG